MLAGVGDISATTELIMKSYSPLIDMTGVFGVRDAADDLYGGPIRSPIGVLDAPPVAPLLSVKPADSYVSDLEARNEVLETENALLKCQVRHLKQRLNAPAFRDLVELTDPDIPPDDSQFCFD